MSHDPEKSYEDGRRLLEDAARHFKNNDLVKALIDARFPLADAAKAHAALESGAHLGKIVLEA